jgi:hypothetical protein
MVSRVDFPVWHGANAPALVWEPDFTLHAGDVVVLLAKDRFGRMAFTRTTGIDDDFTIDLGANQIVLSPSLELAMSIPIGALTTYVEELHVGSSEMPIATGFLIGRDGPFGADPIVGRIVAGPRGPQGTGVSASQSIVNALIFG